MIPLEKKISVLLSESRKSSTTQYKRDIIKRLDYYYDRQLTYLQDMISTQFAHTDPLSLQPHFFNIVKPIVNETAMIYRSGARRSLIRDSNKPVGAKLTKLWTFIQQKTRYETIMKTANRHVKLCRNVLIKPSFRYNSIKLDILTPNLVDVLVDDNDPTEPDVIAYARPLSQYEDNWTLDNHYVIHYWDKNRYLRLSARGDIIVNPGNRNGINPYDVLPFVRFTDELPHESFFVQGGDDLIIAQDNINIKLTQLNYLVKMQTFSVPILIGYRGPEQITISPGKPLIIPLGMIGDQGSPDFRFESPDPQIKELITLLEHEIMRIFRAYGVSNADFSLRGGVKSGFALVMENLKLLESRENELPFFEDAEEELFEVIKKVWNYHAPFLPANNQFSGVTFPEDIHLKVTVNDISLPQPQGEELAEWRFMFNNKLVTPIDFLIRRYKVTEQEAETMLKQSYEWWSENSLQENNLEDNQIP